LGAILLRGGEGKREEGRGSEGMEDRKGEGKGKREERERRGRLLFQTFFRPCVGECKRQ